MSVCLLSTFFCMIHSMTLADRSLSEISEIVMYHTCGMLNLPFYRLIYLIKDYIYRSHVLVLFCTLFLLLHKFIILFANSRCFNTTWTWFFITIIIWINYIYNNLRIGFSLQHIFDTSTNLHCSFTTTNIFPIVLVQQLRLISCKKSLVLSVKVFFSKLRSTQSKLILSEETSRIQSQYWKNWPSKLSNQLAFYFHKI